MTRGKDLSLTFMQLVSALAVVTLHANGCFWHYSPKNYWFTANIIECVCYFAVPVFFMVTGITLLDYQDRYSTAVFFRKRFEKTVVPYVFWSLFGIVFLLATHRISSETVTVKWIVNGLLSADGIISVYWFFKQLFCVYLCIPLFAALDKEKKTGIIGYIICTGLLINILVPFLISVCRADIPWPYNVTVSSGYLFWALTGYYIYRRPPRGWQKAVIYLLAAAGLIVHIVGTYTLSTAAGSVDGMYKGYLNIPCVLYTVGVFVLLKDISERLEKIRFFRTAVEMLGRYTFPLYLMHWYFLTLFVDLTSVSKKLLWYRLLIPYPVFLAVIAVTWLLRKIRIAGRIVP